MKPIWGWIFLAAFILFVFFCLMFLLWISGGLPID